MSNGKSLTRRQAAGFKAFATVVAIALLTCSISEGAEAKILARSVSAGETPKAHISVHRLLYPRALHYRIKAAPQARIKVQTGIECERGPSVSVKWQRLTALPEIERRVRLPLSKPVRCSVSVYARYKDRRRGRVVIILFGEAARAVRPSG